MSRLSKKEKLRRQRISKALRAFHAEERRKAQRRSEAARKAAVTRKRHREEEVKPKPKPRPKPKPKPEPTYHKPAPEPSPPKPRKRKPKPTIPPPSVIDQIPERPKKKVKRKAPKVKEQVLVEEEPPKERESFVEEAPKDFDASWKGPWVSGTPTKQEREFALAEIFRISEEVSEGLSSERMREKHDLKYPVVSWALTPVINSDGTVSGEVRFEIPKGVDYMAIVQELQNLLPKPEIGNLWITPVVDYEPKGTDKNASFSALSNSPFEPIRGAAYIRAFSVKYDEDIGIKTVTGFAKAQEMADKIDPQQRFIRPTVVRIKLKWSERPPRSSYELRKMAEKEASREARRRIVEGEGFTPIN